MALDLLGDYTPKRERRIQAFLETDFRFRGGLVLSYRCFALCVGFGRSDWQWFRVNMPHRWAQILLKKGNRDRRSPFLGEIWDFGPVALGFRKTKTEHYGGGGPRPFPCPPPPEYSG